MLLGDGFWEVCEEYGGMHSMTILWEVLYLTTDANIIKARSRMLGTLLRILIGQQAMLTTQFDEFVKGPDFRQTMKDVLGEGVFNSDGLWFTQRCIIAVLTRPTI